MQFEQPSALIAEKLLPRKQLVSMSSDEFDLIAGYIYEQTGIQFRESKKYLLENRLSGRLAELGCKNYKDYLMFLKYDQSKKEFYKLASAITINETSFMRNQPQLEVFQNSILPNLFDKLNKGETRNLRIWSAGCSSGEEPYTMGILVNEKFPSILNSRQLEIVATDIDEEVLATARAGIYRQMTMRNISPKLLATYFTHVPGGYAISAKIKSLVKFSNLNLADSARMRLVGDIDVIFFRNVMIYFGSEARQKMIAQMYDSLRPGGYLFLGHSEWLHGISKAFKLLNINNTMVYQKD